MNWLDPLRHPAIFGLLAQMMYPPRTYWPLEFLTGGLGLVYFAFVCWMLVHCLRTEPDRQFWFWLIIVVQGIGPLLYFVLRYLPAVDYRGPEILRRFVRGREVERLKTAAIQIGNPHQFTRWADALRDVGQLDAAASAYGRALAKDPRDLQALWGAAQVATAQHRYADARDLCRQILEKDPQYKFGDVSLELGKCLVELGDQPAAAEHLDKHVRRWRHPEALFLLAQLRCNEGQIQSAREILQAMLHDITASPAAISRKHGRWKSRARQLLRKLA